MTYTVREVHAYTKIMIIEQRNSGCGCTHAEVAREGRGREESEEGREGSEVVSSPDPALLTEEGLVLFEQFLGFADNAVLFSGTPIRSPPCDFIM